MVLRYFEDNPASIVLTPPLTIWDTTSHSCQITEVSLGGNGLCLDRHRLTLVALDARTGARQPALLCGRRMNGALPDGAVGNQVCAFWIAGTNDTDGFSPHPTL